MNSIFRRSVALAALLVCAAGVPRAWGVWSADPAAPMRVCPAAGAQTAPLAAACPGGGAVVVWQDDRNGGEDLYAQRLDAAGVPLWAPEGVPVCTAAGSRRLTAVVPDGAGGAFLCWQDLRNGTDLDVYVQRLDADGHALWGGDGLALATGDGDQDQPDLAPEGAGGVVVVWREPCCGLRAQHLTSAGASTWDLPGVNLFGEEWGSWPVAFPHLAAGEGGATLLTWLDYRAGQFWDAYAQELGADASRQWGGTGVKVSHGFAKVEPKYESTASHGINLGSYLSAYDAWAVPDGQSGAIVGWRERGTRAVAGSSATGRCQRIGPTGEMLWDPQGVVLCASPFMPNDGDVRVAGIADGSGGALFGWWAFSLDPGVQRSGVTHVDATGVGSTGLAILGPGIGSWEIHAVSDGSGGAIFGGDGWPVWAQRFDTSGGPAWPAVAMGGNGSQGTLVGDGRGGAIMAWRDNPAGEGDAIYAARVGATGALGGDRVAAEPVAGACISTVHPCVTVPVNLEYSGTAPVRGYSVTFTLSSELALCGTGIVERSYLSGVAGTMFRVVPNGGGSYTLDCAILGLPCGGTGSGALFELHLGSAIPGGTGTVTMDSVKVRDCDNGALLVAAGPPATIPIDNAAPAPLTDLGALQITSGNDVSGTTAIQLSWTGAAPEDSLHLYRAGFGHYPEYDDAGGAAPAVPSYPPGAPWVPVSVVASSDGAYTDRPGSRDSWYYAAWLVDPCGNVSPASNRAGGVLSYHLGDVSDGVTPGAGDNLVGTEDVSLLGANYAISLLPGDPLNFLDVGPTSDHQVDGLPLTDNRVDFEDLMIFAVNFGQVSKPRAYPAPASCDALRLEVTGGDAPRAGLHVLGTGRVQGLSARLRWNAAVVTPVGVEAGELLDRLGGVAFSPAPGAVDVAVLGMGRGISGEGTLASVRFRRIAPGDPGISLESLAARDTRNAPVELGSEAPPAAPVVTGLRGIAPNPFQGSATLEYGLARAGWVELSIYSVDGRRVADLGEARASAGLHRRSWDGLGLHGEALPSGVYFARFASDGVRETRRIVRLR